MIKVVERLVTNREEECVILEYVEPNKEFRDIKEFINSRGQQILVHTDQKESRILSVSDILYFEAVGELVFAYTSKDVYEVKQRLYQIEQKVGSMNVMRASKSILINLSHLISVRPALNGRLYGKMKNGEEILISRGYAKQISEHILESAYEKL